MRSDRAALKQELLASRPWIRSVWRPAPGQWPTLFWIVLIHVTAAVGVVLTPLPSLPIFLSALALTWLGGMGTTVCYHRSLAHQSVRLNPVVRATLIFFAVLNGSGTPRTWVANHRLHHAHSDAEGDVSSPAAGGFWWAHLRWIWQAGQASATRYCPDIVRGNYGIWDKLQMPLMTMSYIGGLAFGLEGFFWLGSIRLVFALHGQCFVNSICHMKRDTKPGEDASRNVAWLALWHLLQGENWHKNHHDQPWSARLGLRPLQIDVGWWFIAAMERVGLAREVRRPHDEAPTATALLETETAGG